MANQEGLDDGGSRYVHYTVQMHIDDEGRTEVRWASKNAAQQLAEELDGTYLLRTDRTDLTEAELWKLYVLLARIKRSFRYLKSNLGLRPVFHQRTERADAHIFISLLAYHLLHTIERRLPGARRPSFLADDSRPVVNPSDGNHCAPVHRRDGTTGAAAVTAGVGAPQDLPGAAYSGHPGAATEESIVVTNKNDKLRHRNKIPQKNDQLTLACRRAPGWPAAPRTPPARRARVATPGRPGTVPPAPQTGAGSPAAWHP